jgi:hypothetical protein
MSVKEELMMHRDYFRSHENEKKSRTDFTRIKLNCIGVLFSRWGCQLRLTENTAASSFWWSDGVDRYLVVN